MTTASPQEFDRFVKQQVGVGHYGSTEEAYGVALRLLQEYERRRDELRHDIELARQQVVRGEVVHVPADRLSEFFAQMMAEVDAELDAESGRGA